MVGKAKAPKPEPTVKPQQEQAPAPVEDADPVRPEVVAAIQAGVAPATPLSGPALGPFRPPLRS